MKKRATFTVDEDLFEELKFVPRGFSVSEFVSFMLRGMLKEISEGKIMMPPEEFEKWVNSDPKLKRVREGIREAWGPSYRKTAGSMKAARTTVGKKIKGTSNKKDV